MTFVTVFVLVIHMVPDLEAERLGAALPYRTPICRTAPDMRWKTS